MRLLVLGGTVFVGRAIARQAAASGHEVTCVARGVSGAVPEGVRLFPANRDDPDSLAGLSGRFDAVIDVARRGDHVRHALAGLAGRADHWTFVSSCSVYADQATPGQRAMDAPVLAAAPPGLDDGEGERYAPSKVAGEQAVLAAGMPALICRPGLVVGPEDRSDRFSYWVHRLARASDAEPVLAPGHPDDPVQWIDVADLAAWLVGSAAAGRTGAYDAIGAAVSRSHLLTEIATGVGVSATLTWVDQEFLVDHEVQPWQGERSLPLWLPQPEYAGFMARDVTASLAAGLTTRPAARTARDTLDWLATRPADHAWKCGLDAGDEAHLLAVWQSRRPPP